MKIPYQPEIDGLRTISVMIVIFHHLGWSLFSGGYVGVDVFFVISGYLITSIICKEIQSSCFSFGSFYKRRVIRLAPAYFLVLIATSVAGMIIMLPAELENYFESTIYSTFFTANFYMWKEVGGYFGSNADTTPLLHLWSLAVEEQFYIFWPVTLLLGLTLLPRRIFPYLLGVIFLGCLLISEWGTQNYRAAAYYLMPTRAFELTLGALLVFLPGRDWSRNTRNLMGIGGLGLIIYSSIFYATSQPFPGVWGLLPCAGAALIIYFCRNTADYAGKFLASTGMVSIGRVSYPAYLWHWPIIAFLHILKIEITLLVGVLVIATTLAASYLTYYAIERPLQRNKTTPPLKAISLGYILPALAIACVSWLSINQQGWPGRFPDSLNTRNAAILSMTHKMRASCNEGWVSKPASDSSCILGVSDRPVDFLLIGDSHANHFTSMIDIMAKDAGLRGYDITQSNTIFLPDTRSYHLSNGKRTEYKNFALRNDVLKGQISTGHYKAVILGGSFATHYQKGDFESGQDSQSKSVFSRQMREAIELIRNSGARPYIISGSPVLHDVEYDCTLVRQRFGQDTDCSNSLQAHQQHFSEWKALLAQLQLEYPDLVTIEPEKIICNTEVCQEEINGIPLYRDNNHLNHMGSSLIGHLYTESFGNPLKLILP